MGGANREDRRLRLNPLTGRYLEISTFRSFSATGHGTRGTKQWQWVNIGNLDTFVVGAATEADGYHPRTCQQIVIYWRDLKPSLPRDLTGNRTRGFLQGGKITSSNLNRYFFRKIYLVPSLRCHFLRSISYPFCFVVVQWQIVHQEVVVHFHSDILTSG